MSAKLGSFDYKKCKAYYLINSVYFYDTIRVIDLVIIVNLINKKFSRMKQPKLYINRDIKRSKPLLYKWFDDNWDTIEPYLHSIHFFNDQDEEINYMHIKK